MKDSDVQHWCFETEEVKWWTINGDERHAPRSVGTPLHNLYNVRVFTLEKHSLLDHRDTTNATTAKKKSIQDVRATGRIDEAVVPSESYITICPC